MGVSRVWWRGGLPTKLCKKRTVEGDEEVTKGLPCGFSEKVTSGEGDSEKVTGGHLPSPESK